MPELPFEETQRQYRRSTLAVDVVPTRVSQLRRKPTGAIFWVGACRHQMNQRRSFESGRGRGGEGQH